MEKFANGNCLRIGCTVIFTDPRCKDHEALVTAIWGEPDYQYTCINLLWVCDDDTRQDQYGRQIDRSSSVVHKDVMSAGGNCWRFPGEPRPERGSVMV